MGAINTSAGKMGDVVTKVSSTATANAEVKADTGKKKSGAATTASGKTEAQKTITETNVDLGGNVNVKVQMVNEALASQSNELAYHSITGANALAANSITGANALAANSISGQLNAEIAALQANVTTSNNAFDAVVAANHNMSVLASQAIQTGQNLATIAIPTQAALTLAQSAMPQGNQFGGDTTIDSGANPPGQSTTNDLMPLLSIIGIGLALFSLTRD